MDFSFIVPLLALGTLLAVCVFAMVSAARTEQRRHDPNAPVSSLAKDSWTGGPLNGNPGVHRPAGSMASGTVADRPTGEGYVPQSVAGLNSGQANATLLAEKAAWADRR